MKKQLFFFTACSSLFFYSCKKSDAGPNPSAPAEITSKIKTWTDNGGVSSYTYDASGRCTAVEFSSGGKKTYEYSSGMVIQKNFNAANVQTGQYNYELNGDGLVAKETRLSDPGFSDSRLYNNNRQLIKSITSQGGNTSARDYFYTNGNCDSIRFSGKTGWSLTIIYTYHTDKPTSIDNKNEGIGFLEYGTKTLSRQSSILIQTVQSLI